MKHNILGISQFWYESPSSLVGNSSLLMFHHVVESPSTMAYYDE